MNAEEIKRIWSGSPFMQLLQIRVVDVSEGRATLMMPIDLNIHTNHWLGVHGGALAALADSVTGAVCASVGKIAQTINMNIDYISNRGKGNQIFAYGEAKHIGNSTIVIQTELKNEHDELLCCVSNVMFISGDWDQLVI